MNRCIPAIGIGIGVCILGGCLTVLIMLGAGPASEVDHTNHPEPETLSYEFVHDEAIFEQATAEANQMSDLELEIAVREYVRRLQAVEQWAGFLVLYEIQLRQSDPAKLRNWKTREGKSTGMLFATSNMIAHRILSDLKNPDLLREVVIYNYAQCKATIEQMEAFRLRHGKAAITILFDEKADSLYLEAWN